MDLVSSGARLKMGTDGSRRWGANTLPTVAGHADELIRDSIIGLGTFAIGASLLLRCMSLLLAQSGHFAAEFQCPLSGVKRTLPLRGVLAELES
jgi:hypothetical protein